MASEKRVRKRQVHEQELFVNPGIELDVNFNDHDLENVQMVKGKITNDGVDNEVEVSVETDLGFRAQTIKDGNVLGEIHLEQPQIAGPPTDPRIEWNENSRDFTLRTTGNNASTVVEATGTGSDVELKTTDGDVKLTPSDHVIIQPSQAVQILSGGRPPLVVSGEDIIFDCEDDMRIRTKDDLVIVANEFGVSPGQILLSTDTNADPLVNLSGAKYLKHIRFEAEEDNYFESKKKNANIRLYCATPVTDFVLLSGNVAVSTPPAITTQVLSSSRVIWHLRNLPLGYRLVAVYAKYLAYTFGTGQTYRWTLKKHDSALLSFGGTVATQLFTPSSLGGPPAYFVAENTGSNVWSNTTVFPTGVGSELDDGSGGELLSRGESGLKVAERGFSVELETGGSSSNVTVEEITAILTPEARYP